MKNIHKYLPTLILITAVIIGAFFRFYRLGQSPVGVYVDEAALGYNAFSILKTGKDEFGKFFPVMFRSFATFQSPVYTYLAVPFVAIFGLSSFSTRLPSALFGVLSIPLLYFLVKQLTSAFRKNDSSQTIKNFELFAPLSALLLAISPWHIQYSRTAYETNIALFFLLLGSLLFFTSIKKPWIFILSAISFGISFNAYRAETLVVPILVMTLALRFRKEFVSNLKIYFLPTLISSFIGLALIAPTLFIMRTPGFQARTSTMNIFSVSIQEPWGYKSGDGFLNKVINSPQLLSAKEFLSLYTSYFSPRYMFSLGDSGPRKPFPDFGTFFVWQFPLYIAGLFILIKDKKIKSLRYYIFALLLASPIPAAMTRDPYSTLRSLSMVVPLILIISLGLTRLMEISWSFLNKSKYLILIFIIIFSSVRLFISIFYHHDYYRSVHWNYGWEKIVSDFENLDQKLPIVVDNSHGDSYIELLFFLKYDPATYQRENFEVPLSEYYTNMNRNPVQHLGRITVKGFQWGIDTDNIEQYVVADNLAISDVQIREHNMTIIDEVRLPNREIVLRLLKTNPNKK